LGAGEESMSRYLLPGFLLASLLIICAAGASMQDTAVPPLTMQSPAYSGTSGSVTTGITTSGSMTVSDVQMLLAQQDEQKYLRDAYNQLAATYLTVPYFDSMAVTADKLFNYGNTMVPPGTSLDPSHYAHGDPGQIFRSYMSTAGSDPNDGLTVAARSEDLHISDLINARRNTGNPSLQGLYDLELAAARNNLRTVVGSLSAQKIAYVPQYLDAGTYNSIIAGPTEVVTIPDVPAVTTSIASLGITPQTAEMEAEFAAIPASSLSGAETQDVLQLQEEEKMEYDLFTTMANENPSVTVIQMLGQSANDEMNADNIILQRYNISYTPLGPGQFMNPNLQYTYNQLIGGVSVLPTDILSTAAQSEELHIADLSAALTRTDNADLKYIYNHQLALDRNDLREITAELRARGGTYSPQYLTMDSYNAIIGSPVENVS